MTMRQAGIRVGVVAAIATWALMVGPPNIGGCDVPKVSSPSETAAHDHDDHGHADEHDVHDDHDHGDEPDAVERPTCRAHPDGHSRRNDRDPDPDEDVEATVDADQADDGPTDGGSDPDQGVDTDPDEDTDALTDTPDAGADGSTETPDVTADPDPGPEPDVINVSPGFIGGACIDGTICTEADPDPCNEVVCTDGICVAQPKDCGDDEPCTDDSCEAGTCKNVSIDCDDGNLCTDDKCVGGLCPNPVTCVEGEECDPDVGCVDVAGDPCATPSDCPYQDECTEAECVEQFCVYKDKTCDDGQPDTVDSCDPVDGCKAELAHCNTDQDCVDQLDVEDPCVPEWCHLDPADPADNHCHVGGVKCVYSQIQGDPVPCAGKFPGCSKTAGCFKIAGNEGVCIPM